MPVKINFKKALQGFREWLAQPDRSAREAACLFNAAAAMAEPPDDLASSLEWYPDAIETSGTLALPSAEGWIDVRRAWMLYHAINMTIVANPRQNEPKLYKFTAMALFGFLALGEDRLARWTALHLQARGSRAFILKSPPPSELFACALEALASGDTERFEFLRKAKNLSYYRDVFDSWNDEAAFPGAICKVLDFHSTLTRSDSDYEDGMSSIWPLEITAIRAIRRREGLSFPLVDHMYCASPFYYLDPPALPPFQDDDFEDIAAAMLPAGFFESSLEKAEKSVRRKMAKEPAAPVRKASEGPATQEEFEALLLGTGEDDGYNASAYEKCLVVDWRENPDAVVALFDEHLPNGALAQSYSGRNEEKLDLEYAGKKASIKIVDRPEPPAFDVVKAMAKIIRLDFETRAFEWSLESDTWVLYVAKPEWWSAMEKKSKAFKGKFKKV